MAPKKKSSPKKTTVKAKRKPKTPAKRKTRKLARGSRFPGLRGANPAAPTIKGRGSRTGGQSGDTEGLSDSDRVDSESVEELVEEGQDFEAGLVDAVENAPDPDQAELDAEVPEEDDQDPDARSFSKRNRL